MGEMSPAFQFYARDFLVSTSDLTDEQEGVYTRLLCFAWDRGGLPLDEARIQRLRPWPDDVWARCWPEIKDKWVKRGDKLINPRQERERDAQKARRDGASVGGKRGAETRKNQRVSQVALKSTASQLDKALQANGNTALASALASTSTTTTNQAEHPPIINPSSLTLSHGQIRASLPGLVGAWNNVAAAHPPLKAVPPDTSSSSLSRALGRRPDISWWADVFRALTESDYCMGRTGGEPFTFWGAVDKAEEIAGGKYAKRIAPRLATKPHAQTYEEATADFKRRFPSVQELEAAGKI
jgi:uncharacterized protein YdaU (DUF1376 family)